MKSKKKIKKSRRYEMVMVSRKDISFLYKSGKYVLWVSSLYANF